MFDSVNRSQVEVEMTTFSGDEESGASSDAENPGVTSSARVIADGIMRGSGPNESGNLITLSRKKLAALVLGSMATGAGLGQMLNRFGQPDVTSKTDHGHQPAKEPAAFLGPYGVNLIDSSGMPKAAEYMEFMEGFLNSKKVSGDLIPVETFQDLNIEPAEAGLQRIPTTTKELDQKNFETFGRGSQGGVEIIAFGNEAEQLVFVLCAYEAVEVAGVT